MWLALIRHAAVAADVSQPSALWPLSDAGRRSARVLAGAPLWRDVVRIFTSPELKAHETAQIIAGTNGITVTAVEDLREVERPVGQWHDDYPAAVAAYFARPQERTHGWEPPAAVQARMRRCIDGLITWQSAPVAVCGHGLSLALYLASITGAAPERIWPAITLPDLAVVDPARPEVLYQFGRWAAETGGGVSALAPTAWGGEHPT